MGEARRFSRRKHRQHSASKMSAFGAGANSVVHRNSRSGGLPLRAVASKKNDMVTKGARKYRKSIII